MTKNIKKDVCSIRRQTAETSILAFAMIYLKHHLNYKPSKVHLEIYEILQVLLTDRGKSFVLAAPRDFGKSTMITVFYVLFCICFQKERFILLISNTSKMAIRILDNIKSELVNNPLLREDFPEVFEFEGEPKPPRWTRNEIETRTEIKIVALGAGESCRGIRYKQHRPTLIIGDDVEKGNAYSTIESLEKVKDWFRKSVLRLGSNDSNFIVLGTFFHPYCLIGELLDEEKSPDWERRRYQALISFPENEQLWEEFDNIFFYRKEYKAKTGPEAAKKFYDDHAAAMDKGAQSLWAEKWSIPYLMTEKTKDPVVFSSEFQNIPADPKTLPFSMQELHFWSDEFKSVEDLQKFVGEDCCLWGSCDPAMGKGDYTAIVVMLKDNKTQVYYVIHADIRRSSVYDTISDIIALARRYSFSRFIVEANGFQELMVNQLQERCYQEGVPLNVEVVKNSIHKTERIRSMQSVTRLGQLKFSRNHHLLLEQLCFFPMHKLDDGPDALELIVRSFQTLPVMINPVRCEKLNSVQSSVLSGVPNLYGVNFPQVYQWMDDDNKEPPLKSGGPIQYGF